ncbi:MAG: sugar phosphate isomerase/epimerase, partial [Rhodobacteraceae bacterium]|nr:sugar phosphate isomerase/epimerase [Paracoccaceae bacterium]
MTAKVLAIQETPLYSLAHLTLISATVPELIYIAARAGYDAVSPRLIPMHVDGEFTQSPVNRAQVQAAKTALSTTGLKVLDIELARITEDCDPRSFERALELGGELGAKRMIMSAWTPTRDDRNFLVDVYGET